MALNFVVVFCNLHTYVHLFYNSSVFNYNLLIQIELGVGRGNALFKDFIPHRQYNEKVSM